LLLVLPIQAYHFEGRIFIDRQACNGLRLWLENFAEVVVACPTYNGKPPSDRSPIDEVVGANRLSFVQLPVAYTPLRFFLVLRRTAITLERQISASKYLHFAIGGLWGDWAAIACLLAAASGRRVAVWTDRVESAVAAFNAGSKRGFKRAYARSCAFAIKYFERHVIRRCAVGLFHGMDCYSSYARYCRDPFLVHDIHLDEEDRIDETELGQRLRRRGGPLRVAYAGRVHIEKGVFDWIEALSLSRAAGLEFRAVWFGEGPELSSARQLVVKRDLDDCISFPGAMQNHRELIRELKNFDVFVFCHLTPESPRCLIEALICGLPIIGYDSPYQRDLIRHNGGGILTKMGDPALIAKSLAAFLRDRGILTRAARKDGAAFTAREVFKHRSELIRLAQVQGA
jgi:glycosyltransferase involved in cell wall biosynthesis